MSAGGLFGGLFGGGTEGAGFLVQTDQVKALSQTFDGQQQRPPQLASQLDGAGKVVTGDMALDTAIGSATKLFSDMLTGLGRSLGEDAQGLSSNAQTYEATDASAADTIRQRASTVADLAQVVSALAQRVSPMLSPSAPSPAPGAQPSGIVDQLGASPMP